MGLGSCIDNTTIAKQNLYSWSEVSKHTSRDDKWIVIDNHIYDVTRWSRKHPGGSRVLSHYAGQDASEAFRAFHNKKDYVGKFMKALYVGQIRPDNILEDKLKDDMEELRNTAVKMGLFKSNVLFYILMIAQILILEMMAHFTMWYFGTGWVPYLTALVLYVIVQGQDGWIQHDFGHRSVFHDTKLDRFLHRIVFGQIKGACCDWWNHLHYQHHAKPNIIDKDPDTRLEKLFVVGEVVPKRIAQLKTIIPFDLQHKYFFFIGPPLLFPIYFQYMIFNFAISRKKWVDLMWMLTFYIKFFCIYTPLLGVFGALKFYFVLRVLESHWFVWVTQSNHIPMNIVDDTAEPWISLQLHATCNIERSVFNDWFTGHLNFQIEHHLFPTMPRHNLYKIAPLVKSLCEKHRIPYIIKPISKAFGDVIRSLKSSGELWKLYKEAYNVESVYLKE